MQNGGFAIPSTTDVSTQPHEPFTYMVFNDAIPSMPEAESFGTQVQVEDEWFDNIDDFAYVYFPDSLIMPSPTTGIQHNFIGDNFGDGNTTWSEITFYIPGTWSWSEAIAPQTIPDGSWAAGGNNHITFTDSTQPGQSFWMGVEYWDAVNIIQICYTAGVRILMADGSEKLIEDIAIGDMVMTRSGEAKPVRWIGDSTFTNRQFRVRPKLRPIKIAKGALGNDEEMRVSPQHCFLIEGPLVEMRFGEEEALVPAVSLLNDTTITVDHEAETVTYYHLMMDEHELVCANGVWSETLFLGEFTTGVMNPAHRDEIAMIFPELIDGGPLAVHETRAAPKLKPSEVALIL